MNRQPSRITGLWRVPTRTAVDWDMVASQCRSAQSNRLVNWWDQRRGLAQAAAPHTWRLSASRGRLLRELHDALQSYVG